MIKCLICGVGYNLAGIETYAITQLKFLNKAQYHFDFVYALKEREIAFKDEIIKAGSQIYNICNSHEWKLFLREHASEYNIVIFNTPFPTFLPILKCHKYKNLKIIVHSHNAGNVDNPWFIRIFTGISLFYLRKKMDSINVTKWACSAPAGIFMFGSNSNFTIINNAIDVKKFLFSDIVRSKIRKQYNISDTKTIIGHIGRFEYVKNHALTVDVFYDYYKRNKNSELWFIGAEIRPELVANIKEKIKKYGIEKNVRFIGPVFNVNEYYQAMDVFFLPSRSEGLGIVAIEAQAADLPCLISDQFPSDIELSDKLIKCSLAEPLQNWAEKLSFLANFKQTHPRTNKEDMITQAGFNINYEIRRVEKLLYNLVK